MVKTSCVRKSREMKTTHYMQQYKLKKHIKESVVSRPVHFVKRIWELFKNKYVIIRKKGVAGFLGNLKRKFVSMMFDRKTNLKYIVGIVISTRKDTTLARWA